MRIGRINERLGWALNAVGAFVVAVGSVLIMIDNWPSLWLILGAAGAVGSLSLAGYRWSGNTRMAKAD